MILFYFSISVFNYHVSFKTIENNRNKQNKAKLIVFDIFAENYNPMIQRIQTVYLLLAEILLGILFFVPFAEISSKQGILYHANLQGIYQEGAKGSEFFQSNLLVLLFWIACLIITGLTIFMFKNRKRQVQVSIFNSILSLIISGLIFLKVLMVSNQLSGNYSLTVYLVFPVISAILIYLAIKAIEKDEMLVRSIDRIR